MSIYNYIVYACMLVCVCVCACVHACACVCMCMYIIYMYACVHACACVCTSEGYSVWYLILSSEDRFGTNSSPVSLLLSPFHDGTDQVQILHLVVAWGQ